MAKDGYDMRVFSLALLSTLACTACTTERVATEFSDLDTMLENVAETVEPRLKPGLEAVRQAEITAAAQAGDPWFLSDDCNFVLAADARAVPDSNCTVTKVRVEDRPPVIGAATAAKRKLETLQAYVAALGLLMDASLEEDVVTAYSAAVSAFGDLGAAADSLALIEFIEERQENRDKADAAVSAAIAALRYKRMRSVVLASDADVSTVVRELQLHMLDVGVDPEFMTRKTALERANEAVLLADTTDTAAYRAALVALEDEHAAFMDYYRDTQIYAVGLVGRSHAALAAALRSKGSVEDVVSYLRSLKALADTLRE